MILVIGCPGWMPAPPTTLPPMFPPPPSFPGSLVPHAEAATAKAKGKDPISLVLSILQFTAFPGRAKAPRVLRESPG